MQIQQKQCITFAGVVGTSKTPIAHYLSCHLDLPIFSNDTIRSEVSEDLGGFDLDEYKRRRDERGRALIATNTSFIYDASVDREWLRLHSWLTEADYRWYIISLDLSCQYIEKLYRAKGYAESQERLDQLIEQHEEFLTKYGDEVSLHITDEDFPDRLTKSLQAVAVWRFGQRDVSV